MKINKKQEKELFHYMERELKKLEQVFKKIKLKEKKFSNTFNLALSYFKDSKHFYKKQEYVKCFELLNYTWGLLDALAISKGILVPKTIKKWFKIEQ
ncbi:MAG: DUF357 domain-containing protein [archaeon]|nr:MAG: DUF357 domain-containing protein [archaeon]